MNPKRNVSSLARQGNRLRRLGRLAGQTVIALLTFCSAAAAQSVEVVVDFGSASGQQPKGGLVEASDGCLYGTTVSGGDGGTIYRICDGIPSTVYNFATASTGSYPEAGLTLASDGLLYGVNRLGTAANKGTIYRFDPRSATFTLLHTFSGANGAEPRTELTEHTDGRLYGATTAGGSSEHGAVFSIERSGSGFKLLGSFNNTNGRIPMGRLLSGPDGLLYGTTANGGAAGLGTVYKIGASGGLAVLHSFNGTNGSGPRGGLLLGADGMFYGTTSGGGASGVGTIFRIDASGAFTSLKSFAGTNGSNPYAELIYGSDGMFYGTTMMGGANSIGVLYKADTAGTITVLRSLATTDGGKPESPLTLALDGWFYGAMPTGGPAGAAGTVVRITASGAFERLTSFSGTPANPYGPLMEASDGYLYGVSYRGGSSTRGTIFRMRPGVSFEVAHAFAGLTDGGEPYDGLTEGTDGNFYFSTQSGGVSNVGAILKRTDSGVVTQLTSLTSSFGMSPYASPVQATDGNLYGVTSDGGGSYAGTIYKLTPAGAYSVVHSFNGGSQGETPYGRLLVGPDGTLYGTTISGGATSGGTLFAYDPFARSFRVLHSFSDGDGVFVYAALSLGTDGRIYGAAYGGGASGYGTIFAYDIGADRVTTLHSFALSKGAHPYGRLIEWTDGRLYGTCSYGGANTLGSLFSIGKDGSGFTLLHSFKGSDGSYPRAGLALSRDGYLYGTAPLGGSSGNGVVYRIRPGIGAPPPPPVTTIAVTSPNTVITVTEGSTLGINWTHNMGAGSLVRIDVSRDGGGTWSEIAASVANGGATNGTYNWVASGASTQARIRVSTVSGAASDLSDVNFTIAAATVSTIKVTAPNTAINWAIGSTQEIKWTHNRGAGAPVRIQVSRDGGATWTDIAASVASSGATAGSYKWVVTSPASNAARIRVSFTDGARADDSDTNFTIAAPYLTVTSPNLSSHVWTVGTTDSITWTSNLGTLEKVKIELSRDGGLTYPTVLFSSTASDGKQTVSTRSEWVSSTAKVRITWLKDTGVKDVSDQAFSIR